MRIESLAKKSAIELLFETEDLHLLDKVSIFDTVIETSQLCYQGSCLQLSHHLDSVDTPQAIELLKATYSKTIETLYEARLCSEMQVAANEPETGGVKDKILVLNELTALGWTLDGITDLMQPIEAEIQQINNLYQFNAQSNPSAKSRLCRLTSKYSEYAKIKVQLKQGLLEYSSQLRAQISKFGSSIEICNDTVLSCVNKSQSVTEAAQDLMKSNNLMLPHVFSCSELPPVTRTSQE